MKADDCAILKDFQAGIEDEECDVETCAQSEDCCEGFICDDSGATVSVCVEGCEDSEDCQFGYICLKNQCRPGCEDTLSDCDALDHQYCKLNPRADWGPVSYTHLTLPTKA